MARRRTSNPPGHIGLQPLLHRVAASNTYGCRRARSPAPRHVASRCAGSESTKSYRAATGD
eukprot:scaffold25107_cov39-Phaeocystis_antarctica.AAC.1